MIRLIKFDRQTWWGRRHYFRIVANNNHTIAQSEAYNSAQARDKTLQLFEAGNERGRLHPEDMKLILKGYHDMSAALDRLTASVAKESTAVDSIVALVSGLAQQIRDLVASGGDMAAVETAANALADEIDAKSQEIADAVTANTPAAEPPAEPPVA